ncbi:hypothetical protein [Acinetobacter equi]|uniref:hypothetical protein n=1 Tax=Acinetobacter equi TaxID=1324350 RepID=UPI000AE6C4D5|nr:hypothetical protein [Acinetobacter equi]
MKLVKLAFAGTALVASLNVFAVEAPASEVVAEVVASEAIVTETPASEVVVNDNSEK